MIRLFACFFRREALTRPDDREITEEINRATDIHRQATKAFAVANARQVKDAEFIRETLRGVMSDIHARN